SSAREGRDRGLLRLGALAAQERRRLPQLRSLRLCRRPAAAPAHAQGRGFHGRRRGVARASHGRDQGERLEHDPEKCAAVFGKDYAQTQKKWAAHEAVYASWTLMPYSQANGVDIWYEVTGDGPAMVLVHANPFDHDLWMYQAAHFSTWFTVVGIDIRGYGRSSKVTRPYALMDMAQDVIGVMDDLEIDSPVLAGCSVGSGIPIMPGLPHPAPF